MNFGVGRKPDLLSPEEREIVDRFERGAIDAAEAGKLLIASVRRLHEPTAGSAPARTEGSEAVGEESAGVADESAEVADESAPLPGETSEEAAARALVERIARDIYDDPQES